MFCPCSTFLSVFIVGGCLSALASETFQASWDPLEFNPTARLHPSQRVAIISLPPKGLTVVDKTSDPASPFEGQSALFVKSTEDDKFWLRLGFRAFEETELSELSKGAVEFFLQPEQGSINIQAGYHGDHWIPESQETYFVDSFLFSLSLRTGQEPAIAARVMETDSTQFIEPSESYRVTIKWDLEAAEPAIRVFLNGEPLRQPGANDPFNGGTLKPITDEAINVFRITLGNSDDPLGSFFLGQMVATAGGEDFDVESAEKPLAIP